MVKFRMLVISVLITLPLLFNAVMQAQQKTGGVIEKRFAVDKDGNKLVMRRIAGYPPEVLPKPNTVIPTKSKTINYLSNVPGYTWCYGCTATATAMFVGYYDHFGADQCYTGPENGGVQPLTNTTWTAQVSQTGTDQCPVASSKMGLDGRTEKGHGDDYWIDYLDESDPYYGAWTEHEQVDGDGLAIGQPCTADFMGTNQWNNWGNADGSTSIWNYYAPYGGKLIDMSDDYSTTPPSRDGTHGMRLFFESLGYRVQENYNQLINGWTDPADPTAGAVTGGYRYKDFMAAIDAGRPVLIGLDGHSMLGYGYDNTTDSLVYVRDTWDTTTAPGAHTMVWGADYSGMYHYSVSEIILGSEVYFAPPQNVFALNNNRVVTVTWDDPSLGTKNVTYQVFRDGSQIGTATTESYIDNTASDGVHSYSTKAVYVDEDPDYVSLMSNVALVYVSVSVTEFHDTFESGSSQWLLYNGWGLDTEYKHLGTYSLSDSPTANYADDLEDLTAGGSVGEVAPGLNFTSAVDASCDFWIRYAIEESFDYLHFQACKDGVSWVTLKTWSSETLGLTWAKEVIRLGVFAGESNVRFRFILTSDQGYNAEGSNIDDINIMPSATDTTPPFVYYTKPRDFYDNNTSGFEIRTDITDLSGVDYAKVYYSVDGGAETSINPTTVTGDEYYFVIPPQAVGAYVTFRFDCGDELNNTGYYGPYTTIPGPFFYQAGKHQVYDNGWVTYIVSLSSTPADNENDYVEAIGVKFSIFHDDIAGVVVRGYTDQGQLPNANILVQVYTDNNGLPGTALLPSPVSVPNPATTTETQKWAYVDLSSYSQLDDLEGDYHVVISSGTNNSGYTISDYTEAQEDQMTMYGKTTWKEVPSGGTVAVWGAKPTLNHHTRLVTTDYGIVPGTIDTDPVAVSKTLPPTTTDSKVLNVLNVGGYSLDYTGSIDYNGTAGSTVVNSNDFATVLGYTSTGTTWSRVTTWDGGSFNGTGFAKCSAPTNGAGFSTGYLTTPIVNLSAYTQEGAKISWIQKTYFTVTNSLASVQVSNDGTTWFTIYSTGSSLGAWSNGNSQSITVPSAYLTSTARFRFVAYVNAKSNNYFAIDNVSIAGYTGYTWMTLDGGSTTSGTVAAGGSDPLTVGFNTAGLTLGQTYTAAIKLTSKYSSKNVLVTLTVSNLPGTPELVSPANLSSTTDTTPTFDWSDVTGATSYTILVDNNADFSSPEITSSPAVSTYTPAVALTSGDYYWKVLATNSYGSSSYTSSWMVTISGSGPVIPAVPAPITTSIVTGNVKMDWPDMADATSYDVYSSTTPYGTFALLTNVTVSEYTYTPTATKMFFYFVSKNSTKESPKTIEIKRNTK